jgi:hypothetical protein
MYCLIFIPGGQWVDLFNPSGYEKLLRTLEP